MNCDQAEPLLHRYVEGDLAAYDVAALERHLETCEPCTRVVELLAEEAALFAVSFRHEPLPPDFTKQVITAITVSAEAEPEEPPASRLGAARLVTLMGLFVVVALATVWVLRERSGLRSDEEGACRILGKITLYTERAGRWEKAGASQDVCTGEVWETGSRERAVLALDDGSELRLGRQSLLEVVNRRRVNLDQGQLWLYASADEDLLSLHTPAAWLTMSDVEVHLRVTGDELAAVVIRGQAQIENDHGARAMAAGYGVAARRIRKPARPEPRDVAPLVRWAEELGPLPPQRVVVADDEDERRSGRRRRRRDPDVDEPEPASASPRALLSLRGSVLTIHGKLIPEASVTALLDHPARGPSIAGRTVAKTGDYLLPVAPERGVGTITIVAEAKGYAPGVSPPLRPPEKLPADLTGLEVVLAPVGSVSGVVTSATGVPVTGARVRASLGPVALEPEVTVTDERGMFVIGRLPLGGAVALEASVGQRRVVVDGVPVGSEGVEIIVAESSRVEGSVVSVDGEPVGKVAVSLEPTLRHGDRRSTSADSDGAFQFVGLPPGTYELIARRSQQEGRTRIAIVSPPEVVQATIVVRPAAKVAGRVLDVTSGRTVTGLAVVLTAEGRPPLETETDEAGVFLFESVRPGTYRASVKPGQDYASSWGWPSRILPLEPGALTEGVDLYVTRGATATLSLVGPDEAPAPSATVVRSAPGTMVQAAVGADGKYVLRGIPPGARTIIEAWTHDHLLAGRTELVAAAGEVRALVIEMRPSAMLTGKVMSASGESLCGALVHVVHRKLAKEVYPPKNVRTARTGEFRVEGLMPGPYLVSAIATGHASARPSEVTIDTRGVTLDLELAPLDGALTIEGRVADAAGNPLAGALVQAGGPVARHAMTNPNGLYRITSLAEGRRIDLTASLGGYVSASRKHVAAGQRGVDLTLEEQALLRGRVVDSVQQKPIRNFSLQIYDTVCGLPGSPTLRPRETVWIRSSQGRFQVRTSVASPLLLVKRLAEPADAGSGTAGAAFVGPLDLAGKVTVDGLVIEVPAGLALRGQVTDSVAGAPLGAAQVILCALVGPEQTLIARPISIAYTDGQGNFSFWVGTAGTYKLFASHPRRALGASQSFVVDGAAKLEPKKIALAEGGSLRIIVHDERGEPETGSLAVLKLPLGEEVWTTRTDSDGLIVLERAPAGIYGIAIKDRSGGMKSFRVVKGMLTKVYVRGEATPIIEMVP